MKHFRKKSVLFSKHTAPWLLLSFLTLPTFALGASAELSSKPGELVDDSTRLHAESAKILQMANTTLQKLWPDSTLVVLQSSDFYEANQVLFDAFSQDEPMNHALLEQTGQAELDTLSQVSSQITTTCIDHGLSLAIIDKQGKIQAIILTEPHLASDDPGQAPMPPPMDAIEGVLIRLSQKYSELHEAQHQRALHLSILAVTSQARGKRLSGLLVDALLALAKVHGYDEIVTDATSTSQEVFVRHGFSSYASVVYADYEWQGNKPFAAIKPFSTAFPEPACHLMIAKLSTLPAK